MTNNNWQVLKFGGTSVSTQINWESIYKIIENKLADGHKVFVVHSALSQVSNKLERILDLAELGNASSQEFDALFKDILDQHYSLIADLKLSTSIVDELFDELQRILTGIQLLNEASDKARARVLSFGELLSTTIGYHFLNSRKATVWLDARKWLKASSEDKQNFLSVNCDFNQDEALCTEIADQNLVITQGFIASNALEETCLLGRGGSDTSAAYFSSKVNADCLEIWTDVAGIYSANPKQVTAARVIQQLSYSEAQELASAGAKVLHPRSIRPAQTHNIPVYIRSTIEPEKKGTLITSDTKVFGMVKAITAKSKVTLVSMETMGMWQQSGFLGDVFAVFKTFNISVDLVSTSESNVTVTLDTASQLLSDQVLEDLKSELAKICRVDLVKDASTISIVGQNVRALLHKIAPALKIFENYQIYLVSQSASDLNLSFVIDGEHEDAVVRHLHEILVTNNPNSQLLGPTAIDQKEKSSEKTKGKSLDYSSRWWANKTDELKNVLENKSSAYVYNLDTVSESYRRLSSLSSISRVHYAVKANNNPQILETIEQQGGHFETVSIFEVEYLLEKFKDLQPSDIFFTPNFAEKKEYQKGLELGVNLSLDSTYPLLNWPEIFANKSIFLRIDPNIGKGHHENVRTAGATSKFGIPLSELDSIKEFVEQYDITIIGLHAHAGSGILNNEHWAEHASLLSKVAEQFPHAKYLNLGGGFGIKENASQHVLDLSAIDKSLQDVKAQYPKYEYWIEPGRYLVADAGALIAKVTQVKQKQNYYYVGLATGMNSLLRPALYNARHPILNLDALDKANNKVATLVGPICESTDKIAVEIPFPETEEGDLILIDKVGAYGYVMSSHYNMRAPAEEVCL